MAVFPLLGLPPEEWLGFELSFLSGRLPLRGGDGFLWESESTAADRATVDMRRGGVSSAMRVTAHDSSLCRGSCLEACKKMAMTYLHRHGIFDDTLVSSFFVLRH